MTKTIPKIKLSLDISGQIFRAKTNTFSEALDIIQKGSVGKVKTWGIFILETEGKKAQLQLRPFQIRKAFIGRYARDLLEKRMRMALK